MVSHRNIVRFWGYYFDIVSKEAWIICNWAQHGEAASYVSKTQPDTLHRLQLVGANLFLPVWNLRLSLPAGKRCSGRLGVPPCYGPTHQS